MELELKIWDFEELIGIGIGIEQFFENLKELELELIVFENCNRIGIGIEWILRNEKELELELTWFLELINNPSYVGNVS